MANGLDWRGRNGWVRSNEREWSWRAYGNEWTNGDGAGGSYVVGGAGGAIGDQGGGAGDGDEMALGIGGSDGGHAVAVRVGGDADHAGIAADDAESRFVIERAIGPLVVHHNRKGIHAA